MGLHPPKWACMVFGMDITAKTAHHVAALITQSGHSISSVAADTLIPRTTLQRKLNGAVGLTMGDLQSIGRSIGKRTREMIPADVLSDEQAADAA